MHNIQTYPKNPTKSVVQPSISFFRNRFAKTFISLFNRGVFDRQDSLRSDYLSDRETRYGIVQQASIDSTDSRLCYLTSSEVSEPSFIVIHKNNSDIYMS